jgi:hypothetical protein
MDQCTPTHQINALSGSLSFAQNFKLAHQQGNFLTRGVVFPGLGWAHADEDGSLKKLFVLFFGECIDFLLQAVDLLDGTPRIGH